MGSEMCIRDRCQQFPSLSESSGFLQQRLPCSAKRRPPDPAGLYFVQCYCLADESSGDASGKPGRTRRCKGSQTGGIHCDGRKSRIYGIENGKAEGFPRASGCTETMRKTPVRCNHLLQAFYLREQRVKVRSCTRP